jgi:hypothetical protein
MVVASTRTMMSPSSRISGVRYFFPGLLSGTVVDKGSHGFLR